MSERAWSELPQELTSLILCRLLGKDVTVFRAVCRNWSSVPSPRTKHLHLHADEFNHPFMFRLGSPLYSPVYNSCFEVRLNPNLIDEGSGAQAQIQCSNYGWVLIYKGGNGNGNGAFWFLQPSTGELVNLPYTVHSSATCFNQMSFSAPPTSPDCTVFGLRGGRSSDRIHTCLIRRGDSGWREYNDDFPCPDGGFWINASGSVPVFHRGAFYCLSEFGRVGVFDPRKTAREDMWRLLNKAYPAVFHRRVEAYLTQDSSSSSLLAVVVELMGEYVKLFKFIDGKNWHPLSTLENHATIFLSPTSSIVWRGTPPYIDDDDDLQQLVNVKGLENTIHFTRFRPNSNYNVFYSVFTRKFHSFEGLHLNDLCHTQLQLNCTWIIPQLERVSHPPQLPCWINLHQVDKNNSFILMTKTQQQPVPVAVARPWLVLSREEKNDVLSPTLIDLDLANGRRIRDEKMEAMLWGKKVYGTNSNGLILVADSKSGDDCLVFDTLSMTTVYSLPALRLLKNFYPICCLLHLPPAPGAECVIAIFGGVAKSQEGKGVATLFCRPGDQEWTTFVGGQFVYAAASCQGKIYGIQRQGVSGNNYHLAEVEFESKYFRSKILGQLALENNPRYAPIGSIVTEVYLVELGGQLFLFHKYSARWPMNFMGFKAYMMMDMRTARWELMDDLGDRAFFFDKFHTSTGYGCRATESGFKNNQLYFIDKGKGILRVYDYGNHSISMAKTYDTHQFHACQLVMCCAAP